MAERPSRVDLERMRANYEERKAALAGKPAADRAYVVRVVASIEENVRLTARSGRWRFASDEAVDRGGTDTAMAPLQYFLGGAAF